MLPGSVLAGASGLNLHIFIDVMNPTASFFRLDGKVALVTGGGQGIGEAIGRRLEEAGARVALFDLRASAKENVDIAIGGHSLNGDVNMESDCYIPLCNV